MLRNLSHTCADPLIAAIWARSAPATTNRSIRMSKAFTHIMTGAEIIEKVANFENRDTFFAYL